MEGGVCLAFLKNLFMELALLEQNHHLVLFLCMSWLFVGSVFFLSVVGGELCLFEENGTE